METRLESLLERTTLIAGVGRSGTTWLGKLLDANPHVFYRHEPDNRRAVPWFRDVPSRLDPAAENDRYRDAFAEGIARTCRSHGIHFVKEPEFPKAFLRSGPWRAANLALKVQRKLLPRYLPLYRIPRWMTRGDLSGVHYVLKSVTSNLRLAWIHRHFPAIKIVMILRHPGGYLGSWLRAHEREGWSGFGERSRLDSTVLPFPLPRHQRYLEAYEKGTPFERELIYWIVANETPLELLSGSSAVKVVVYEELCREPERVIRDVCAFCGIDFGDGPEQFVRESTSQHEDGFHAVHKNPAAVVDRWRTQLDEDQLQTVSEYLSTTDLHAYWDGPSAGSS